MKHVIMFFLLLPLTAAATTPPLRRRTFALPCHDLLKPDAASDFSVATEAWLNARLDRHLRDRAAWHLEVEYVLGEDLRQRALRAIGQHALFARLAAAAATAGPAIELTPRSWQAIVTKGRVRVVLDALHYDVARAELRSGEVLIDAPAAAVDLDHLGAPTPLHALRIARPGGERLLLALDLDAPLETRLAETLRLAERIAVE